MWQYPALDPVALSLGPVKIHWYAVSYLVGIGLVWWATLVRIRVQGRPWSREAVSDLIFYAALGLILGGRLGYTLFYGFAGALADPLSVLRIWEGGMSFHGGLLGALAGAALYGRRHRRGFFAMTDLFAPAIPLALCCGRLGNFVNGELPGRTTQVDWAVLHFGEAVGRHPSSLYQAALEGPVLFAILWLYARRPRRPMAVSAVFLLGYGCLRIFSELFRQPDPHIGFVLLDSITLGQLLSLPMVLAGLAMLLLAHKDSSDENRT